ncbi:hypothetical protein EGT74_06380 [Chitinophaga lutea]|uniref:Uncharacterized protein n=2 Tax=Chitinophaga lutea TaxID=2488634 RepID=A0A3N4PWH9_9BACT|nr:hypothetical protein EGT74_06380 [Chitinophaga lutea]
MPPAFNDVKIYFSQKGISETEATQFFLFHDGKAWTNRKGRIRRNWKNIAYQWIQGCIAENPWLFRKDIH